MSIPGTPNDISTPRPGDHIGPMSFRKKPVEIEAMRWSGHNLRQIIDFTGLHPSANKWTWEEYEAVVAKDGLKIFTLEGPLMAAVGDWIIKGVKGEFYPCKPDIFAATYQSSHVVHHGGVCISCRDEIEAASPPSADERIAELEREVFAKEQEALLARAGWIVRENEIERLKGELADTKRRLADAFRALDNAASSPSAAPTSSAVADAAAAFRESLVPMADEMRHGVYPLWHGWAIYDAFIAGARFAQSASGDVTKALAAKLNEGDARRYRWLKKQYIGLDFEWGKPACSALIFEMPPDCRFSADLDKSIDDAMLNGSDSTNEAKP